MFEGLRKRREERRQRQEDICNKLHAFALGQEAGDRMTGAVDIYLNARLESAHSKGMDVLKDRFKTIYDSPGYDPKTVAAVELKIFEEALDKLPSHIKPDIRALILNKIISDVSEIVDDTGALNELLDTYIDRQIANTVEKMTNEGIALFEQVVAEIDAKRTKPPE